MNKKAILALMLAMVMPFAGYLVYNRIFDIYLITLVGAIGCTTGSFISYYVGMKGGRPLIEKYGKYPY